MSTFYKIAYMIGMTPWEEMSRLPIARQISSLLDREQQERQPPYGSALDLGCGSGNWSVELATRGWQVTGIDIVPKALCAARERTRDAGVVAQFVKGDMTDFGPMRSARISNSCSISAPSMGSSRHNAGRWGGQSIRLPRRAPPCCCWRGCRPRGDRYRAG